MKTTNAQWAAVIIYAVVSIYFWGVLSCIVGLVCIVYISELHGKIISDQADKTNAAITALLRENENLKIQAKKTKILIGIRRDERDATKQETTEINFNNIVSIEKGSDWESVVRTTDGRGYIFDSYEITDK